jgi:hypothetical protein
MLLQKQIAQIHELHHQQWSERRIAQYLGMGATPSRSTSNRTINAPRQQPANRSKPRPASSMRSNQSSTTGSCRNRASVPALSSKKLQWVSGFDCGYMVVNDYLQAQRPRRNPRAFVRMEPLAGERFEIDWAHFDTLDWGGDKHKLYAFCMVEGHSRLLYVEFTYSQSFETFLRCHIHAFRFLGGVARECLLRQSGDSRCRTRRQPHPLSSTPVRVRQAAPVHAARLQCDRRLGKGQSRTGHRDICVKASGR